MKYKNLPNAITIGRIILVPFFILCYYLNIDHWNYYAAAIFIVAALSDMLDGMIARKYQLVSNIGKFMDPIADKILAMAALLLLMEWGKLPAWVCIILLGREFIISGFRLIAASEGVVLAAGEMENDLPNGGRCHYPAGKPHLLYLEDSDGRDSHLYQRCAFHLVLRGIYRSEQKSTKGVRLWIRKRL